MFLLAVCYALVYGYFQSQGIPAGDSGDLVTAAVTLGIAHPPGYPLYVILGWIVNHVPVLTPAWRVGLLSSIPHAITLYVIGIIVHSVTKSKIAGIFATIVLFGNYIFFLYSITPEVFALLDMFIVLCIWLLIQYHRTHSITWLYWLIFLFGISLTHHHLILFIFPAVIYYLYKEGVSHGLKWYVCVSFFVVGILPYAYIVYPPHGTSLIVWNPATDLQSAIKLITRADYGTFQSAIVYGQLPIQRLLNVQTYLQYISIDFLWIGIVLALYGLRTLWKKNHSIGLLLSHMILCIGPLFYFYASFPLSYRFSLGTLERFLLPTYSLLSILIGVGFAECMRMLCRVVKHVNSGSLLVSGISVLLFLYPITLTSATIQKTMGYNTDMTAQQVGEDILASLPPNSIFLADRDTVLFTSEYVRYAVKKRTDIILLQGFKLYFPEQHAIFHDRYPSLLLPDKTSHDYVTDFIQKNITQRRIFSYRKYDMPESYTWEPYGLVYEIVKKENAQTLDQLQKRQSYLWSSFQDPSTGILTRFNHLILSDVRDIYTTARMEYGKTLLFANKYQDSIYEFKKALSYGGDATLAQTYMYKGIAEAILNRCDESISDLTQSKYVSLLKIPELDYYLGVAYRDCVKDQTKADAYFKLFEASKQKEEIPLQSL